MFFPTFVCSFLPSFPLPSLLRSLLHVHSFVRSYVRLFNHYLVLSFLHLFVRFVRSIFRSFVRSEDQQIRQDDLNILAQWEEAWLMKFNVAKCHQEPLISLSEIICS